MIQYVAKKGTYHFDYQMIHKLPFLRISFEYELLGCRVLSLFYSLIQPEYDITASLLK